MESCNWPPPHLISGGGGLILRVDEGLGLPAHLSL